MKVRVSATILARIVGGLVVGWLGSAPTLGACKITQVGELPVSVRHNRALIDGQINGEHINILVDTGSHHTIILRAEAE